MLQYALFKAVWACCTHYSCRAGRQGRTGASGRRARRRGCRRAPRGKPAPPTLSPVWITNHPSNSRAGPVMGGSSVYEGQEGQAEQGQGLQGAAPTAGGRRHDGGAPHRRWGQRMK